MATVSQIAHRHSHWVGLCEFFLLVILLQFVDTFRLWLKSDSNNTHHGRSTYIMITFRSVWPL